MADVTGILAANPQAQTLQNPLDTIGKIQAIKNAQAQNQLIQSNTQQVNQTLNVNRMNRQAQVAMGLYDLPDDQLAGGQPIRDALSAELRAGTIDQNTYQQYMSTLPSSTDADGNPTSADAFRQNIRSHIISTMSAPDAVRFAVGQPGTVDTGGQIVPVMQGGALSANPGAITQSPGGGFQKGLSPGEGAQRVTGPPGPNGEQTTVPLQSVTPPPGGGQGAGGTGGGYSSTNLPPVAGVGGGQTGGQTGGQGGNQPIPGQVTTSLPPSFEDSRKMGQALTSRAENVAQNKGNYQTLLTDLQGINTGPAASVQQHIAAFFQKWAGNPIIAGLTSDDLAKGEGFGKVATQISLAQGQQLGGTDQIQRASASATPNLSLSTPGNTQIIHKLLGNEDAIDAKRNAWNAWSSKDGFGQGSYNQFSQWWNKNVDVRSFQLPYMDDGSDEKRSVVTFGQTPQGINAAKEFVRRNKLVQNAQQNGWNFTGSDPNKQAQQSGM